MSPNIGGSKELQLTQEITPPAVNGGQFAQQPKVTIVDEYGNIRTGDNSTEITVVKEDAGAGMLTGTTIVRAIAGVATFSDLGAANAAQVTGTQSFFWDHSYPEVRTTSSTVTLPAPVGAQTATASAECRIYAQYLEPCSKWTKCTKW